MSTVGVVVATFGDSEWYSDGQEALSIARVAHADEYIHIYGDNLASARNKGWKSLSTDYVVFLDADDGLAPGYCDVLKSNLEDGNILYQPQTVASDVDRNTYQGEPNFIPDRDMNVSNNLVIGTAVKREFCIEFDPVLPALEDWDFFRRMIYKGAKVKQVPGMIYEVGVCNPNPRNAPGANQNQAYQAIRNKNIRVSNYLWESK